MAETAAVEKGNKAAPAKWRRRRRTVQVAALLLFLFLLFQAMPPDIFFHLDPLVAISTVVAGRTWLWPMALAIVTLLLSLALGRAWCGWFCPLGSLIEWTPARRPQRKEADIPGYWRQGKYFLLFVILLAAVLGSLSLLFLDPITILFRTFASAIVPLASAAITAAEEWLYQVSALRPGLEWLDGLLRGSLLTNQPVYLPSLSVVLLFALVLGLNAVRPRFWCRYLCPLGALLALFSRITWVRHRVDNEKCIKCRRCVTACPTAAIPPDKDFRADAAECITCLDCVEVCPTGAVSFARQAVLSVSPSLASSRRQFLVSLGVAGLGAALLRMPSVLRPRQPALIRPPGSSDEQLLTQCLRCGECVKVCPTGTIQPSVADWEGLWTPALNTRVGYCDYSCNACGQVCPTGAITPLPLPEKRLAVIGKAVIDEKRCIPFAEGRDCIVCEEMCPIPEKAIVLEDKSVVNSLGITTTVRQPRVIRRLCTGCGICEYQCPVKGEAAIRINPHGEGEDEGDGQGRGGGGGRGGGK